MTHWSPDLIPDLDGRVAIVTGASSGIGAAAAEVLAAKGASVVLAVRNQAKGEATRAAIRRRHPRADVSISRLDLADLATVHAFADRAGRDLPRIDILINNAGLGLQPKRATTVDGFERQLGTNYLGPFALTGLLLPILLRAAAPRVVAISSIAHRRGAIDFTDLQVERPYRGLKAYSQSKLADLMFALELDRRARAAKLPLISVAAHPGIARTGFFEAVGLPRPVTVVANVAARAVGQDAAHGALPGLYAATMPDVAGGQYFGPCGFQEISGAPGPARIAPQAKNLDVAARLWLLSERLTGVRYAALDTAV